MLMPYIDKVVTVLLATIGSYETSSIVAIVAIAVAAWVLVFGFLLSTGTSKPRWNAVGSLQHLVLGWSWFWTAGAVCGLVSWWGFFAWRLSSGLILIPTAPEEPIGVVVGYGTLAAAALLIFGWLPRVFLPRFDAAKAKTPVAPPVPDEDSSYQPLYPELSFDSRYQPVLTTVMEPPVEAPPAEVEPPKRPRRRRFALAFGVALLVVGVVGAIGLLAAPSSPLAMDRIAPATFDRFALEDISDRIAEIFADSDAPVIRDDALHFQTNDAEVRDGDFALDVDRWRPLAEQGNARAQYKLGVMYANGRGAKRDYIEAYKWLNIAGAQGDEKAIKGRDAVARRMSSEQVETAQNLAREAAAQGIGATVTGEMPARLRDMTERELVAEAQSLLNSRGLNVGIADGIVGRRTRTAVREFERQAGLPVTGEVSRDLVLQLSSDGREKPRPIIDHRSVALTAPRRACDRMRPAGGSSIQRYQYRRYRVCAGRRASRDTSVRASGRQVSGRAPLPVSTRA